MSSSKTTELSRVESRIPVASCCPLRALSAIPHNLFVNHESFSGAWELSADVIANPNREVVLVSAGSPSRSGDAWRPKRAPPAGWSASLAIRVGDLSALVQRAVCLTDDFAPTGDHSGGPAVSRGGALVFEVHQNRMSFEFREKDGVDDLSTTSMEPQLTVDLPTGDFAMAIEVSGMRMIRISATVGGQLRAVCCGRREDMALHRRMLPQSDGRRLLRAADLSLRDEVPPAEAATAPPSSTQPAD
jgi:hypothetical protein